MREVQIKELVKRIVRESFKQSISEASYDLGNKQYTDKNMTPTEILDLAMAYSQTSGNKMYGNKMPKMIKVANDLARLNGTTQLDAKSRGKQPALILVLLKNKLVTKDEYIKLYKDLLERQISVVKALKNSDPASRMVGGAAARQAHKDMKGEFEESVNELKTLPNGNFKIKKKYNTFAEYEKDAKIGDTILKYSKKSPSFRELMQTGDLHSNAKKYLSKVHSIGTDGVNLTLFGKQTPASVHPSDKTQLAVVVLESVVSEMGVNDVHFKNILRTYDHGGPFTKKKVAVAVTKNPNSNRNKIVDNLRDMDYEEIIQVEDDLRIAESVNEAKSDFEVYHKSYTSAINAAKEYAEKKGYEINDDDSFRQIGMGPRKPSEGKVNRFSIELSKDGKVQKKQLQIQVYGMRNVYELNAYIQ